MVWNVGCAPTLNRRIGFITAKLDVSTQRNRRDAIVSLSPLPTENSRSKTDGKGLDANLEQFRNDEMAKLVQYYCRTQNEDERKDSYYPTHQ